MPPGPDPARKRLERLVGTWNATGRTLDSKLAQDGAVMRKVITATLVSVDRVACGDRLICGCPHDTGSSTVAALVWRPAASPCW
jgi:hypothetical protein